MYVHIIWLLIGILSLVSNSTVACIILFCRKLRNRNNAILCSMLISGCAISILYILPGLAFPQLRVVSIFFCSTAPSFAFASFTCYSLHLCGSCLDKVASIVAPFRYKHYSTGRNTAIAIMCFWIIPYLLCAIPFFTYQPYSSQRCIYSNKTEIELHREQIIQTVFFTFMIFIPVVGTITLYVVASIKVNALYGQVSQRPSLHENWKLARPMIPMLGLFCICWIPYFIYFILLSYKNSPKFDAIVDVLRYTVFVYYVVNPIFIAYSHISIHSQIKLFCQGKQRKRRKRKISIHPKNDHQLKDELQVAGATPHKQSK